MDQAYLGIRAFAAYSGLSESTVRRRVSDGSLPFRQLGGKGKRILIASDVLDGCDASLFGKSRPGPPEDPSPPPQPRRRGGRKPQWQRNKI